MAWWLLMGVVLALLVASPAGVVVLRRLAPLQTWRLRRWFAIEGAVTRPRELIGEIEGRQVLVRSFGSDVVIRVSPLRVPARFEVVRRRPGAEHEQLSGDEDFDRHYARRSPRNDGLEILTAPARERLIGLAERKVLITLSKAQLFATVPDRRGVDAKTLSKDLLELCDLLEQAARDPSEALIDMIQHDPLTGVRWAAIEQLSRLTPATDQLRRLSAWAETQPDPEIRLGIAVAIRDRARIDREVQRGEALPVSLRRAAALLERMPASRY